MLVTKSALKARATLNIIQRGFGAAHGHHDDHGHDDHHHDDHHDDHGHDDHGHHHHIEKADVNHRFI